MTGLARSVQWLWALTVIVQMAVLGLLFFKGHFRRLPLFTAYVILNLCQAGFLFATYLRSGFHSHTTFLLAWASEAITLLARILATTELLRLVLRRYRGIWALGWRLLLLASVAVLTYAALDARGNMEWAMMLADRGFHLAFAIAVISFLLLVRYYSVPVHPVYKTILGGFCFYSCTVILTNTFSRTFFLRKFAHYEAVWHAAMLLPYVAVLVVWALALRSSLPAVEEHPALLPTSVYNEVTPLVHARLRLLNDRLVEMLRI